MNDQTISTEQEQAETIVAESLHHIAKRYGISASALMNRTIQVIPLLQSQERIETTRGPWYTADGKEIPHGTQIGLRAWQQEVVEDEAKRVRYNSQRRNGKCRVVKAAA